MDTQTLGRWEERWHPLRQEWVIIAAHRQNRPWSGETVDRVSKAIPAYDPTCYLCPGNQRVSGEKNPNYTTTYVFNNDHPCVGPFAPAQPPQPTGIYKVRPATGVARVICYSPRHDLTLAEMSTANVEEVVATWQQEYTDLGQRDEINHVLIFENKGEVVGVSNPHPHGQIYATNFVFKTMETEASASQQHLAETGRVLFEEILAAEIEAETRIICENEEAIAFIPYFGRYAYEVFVAPKQAVPSVSAMTDAQAADFAAILRQVTIKMDNLWQMSFPYVMVLHNAPTDGSAHRGFHFHIEFHPPLRRPNLLKYLAGPEIGGGNFLADTAADEKAAELRAQSTVHYKKKRRVAHDNPGI